MIKEKRTKIGLKRAIFGCFFLIMGLLSNVFGYFANDGLVYAEESEQQITAEVEDEDEAEVAEEVESEELEEEGAEELVYEGDTCQDSLGAIGWLVCPGTGKIAEAVDWLYGKIESILVINPISNQDGSPIFEIWKYCRGLTNVVFIIFLLVVIYSQITGYGISNYGVKKALPKLIVAAVMVNLSFLVCSLAVDLSNIVGGSVRNLFAAVGENAMASGGYSGVTMNIPYAEIYASLAGGAAIAIGAAIISFETGAIWMLIPVLLGAIVAVAVGLVTIAMRQAVVALLIMVSPLAIVACILPNTEGLFKKWKNLLKQMLVFYPMFSLLFGASNLAGFAIITSAKDGFFLLLGMAVQVFPLFFSWTLMKMSGTILGTIGTKLSALTAGPLAKNRAWAESRRELSKQKHLDSNRAYTPSLKLMQFMSNRKIAREEEISEHAANVRLRGQAYNVRRKYSKRGVPLKGAIEDYDAQADNMKYTKMINQHKNNLNEGLGQLAVAANLNPRLKAKLDELDVKNVNAADELKMELSRGAKIDYDNTTGYYNRVKKAVYANADNEALLTGNTKHQMHGVLDDRANLARYEKMKETMEGRERDVAFIAADAAHTFSSQAQVVRGKFGSYFDNTEATQDIVKEMDKMTKSGRPSQYIDPILGGLRTLNIRGDTNLAREQIDNMLESGDITIGSHALQTISSYCMFDVKGNDPALRRFGKYINLETAKMFNEADPSERRTRKDITFYEYINGEYIDRDANGRVIYGDDGQPVIRKTKKNAKILLKGTSFKEMERTAIMNLDEMIRDASVNLTVDANGNEVGQFDYEKFKRNEKAVWGAAMPNIIGDHFSFLSGSEQIMAMGKGITGIDVKKHAVDWNGIFGKDVARSLTLDQKKDFINFMVNRTKSFLGGQVPVQIARTKSDMLEAIRIQYALKDAVDNNPELLERLLDPNFEMTKSEYKEFERQHLDGVKDAFVNSFKEDALKGFVKMHHKGYQGEAKDGLIQLLEPDRLYERFFPNGENGRRRQRRSDIDDDDDLPINFDDMGSETGGAIYNETRNAVDSLMEEYRGARRMDVDGFWNEIKSLIQDSNEIQSKDLLIDYYENIVSQFTDVEELYVSIMNRIFGGFGNQ